MYISSCFAQTPPVQTAITAALYVWDSTLLGYNVVSLVHPLLMFWRTVHPSSSSCCRSEKMSDMATRGNIWVQCDWSVNGWKVNVANQQGVGGAGLCITGHKTGLQMYPPLVLSGNLHRFLEPWRLTYEMWWTIHSVTEHHILEEQNP